MRLPRFMYRKLWRIEGANLDFIRFFTSCGHCRPQRHPNANTFLAMLTSLRSADSPATVAGAVARGRGGAAFGVRRPPATRVRLPGNGELAIGPAPIQN